MNKILVAFADDTKELLATTEEDFTRMAGQADALDQHRFKEAEYVPVDSKHQTWLSIRARGYSCRAFVPFRLTR